MTQLSKSTRMEYRRSAGFGATRASIRAGELYEDKVAKQLAAMALRSSSALELRAQTPRYDGFVDFSLRLPRSDRQARALALIEVKSQWSADAYDQLNYYAGSDIDTVARICICKVFHPYIPIPEPVQCLRLHDLLLAQPGHLTIIPWSGRSR